MASRNKIFGSWSTGIASNSCIGCQRGKVGIIVNSQCLLRVVPLPGLSPSCSGMIELMALAQTPRLFACCSETTRLAVLQTVSSQFQKDTMYEYTLWTGFTIQLIRGSRRMALCCGSTRMISKYLYVESWLIQ